MRARVGLGLAVAAVSLTVLALTGGRAVAASGDRVLVLAGTVTGGSSSIEASEAAADGLQVDVVDAATWSSMTESQFASYRAIILGDPTCEGPPPTADANAAAANATVWGSAINGNVVILGTDPVYHASQGGETVTRRGIDYAVNQSGKTGAYITLSCYYHETAPNTPVPMLDGIGGGGFTVTGVGCYNDAHIVAESPALAGLTDADISNWSCSVHEAFQTWPSGLIPLAIAKDFDSSFTASDGTQGPPYILAGGDIKSFPLSLTPLNDTAAPGTTHTVTAELLDGITRGPVPDAPIGFAVTAGPNAGVSGTCNPVTCLTDFFGHVSWTYTSNGTAGSDTIKAWYDLNFNGQPDVGEPQTTAGVQWVPVLNPGPKYVAFGDSITTGQSVPTCAENLAASPWRCDGPLPGVPYPDQIAAALGYSYSDDPLFYSQFFPNPGFPPTDLDRVGIWGEKVADAEQAYVTGSDAEGPWLPQFKAIEQAQQLVTGELGIDDLRFSDPGAWIGRYLKDQVLGGNRVRGHAEELLQAQAASFDQMYASIGKARANGAKAVIMLVYNPLPAPGLINLDPDKSCPDAYNIAQTLVTTIDDELTARSAAAGIPTADTRPVFKGHEIGTSDPYVYGKSCSLIKAAANFIPSWVPFIGGGGFNAVKKAFDPHPNTEGGIAIANTILGVLQP